MTTFSVLLALNIVILVLFIINLIIWILFMALLSPMVDPVILLSITDAMSFTFYTEVNLPPWAFTLWAVVYAWQLIWIIYSFILTFKFRQDGPPVLLTPAFLGTFIVALILQASLTISALFILELAFVILLLTSIVLFVALGLSEKVLYDNRFTLAKQNRRKEDILVRSIVHNGIGLYAMWTALLGFINIAIVIAYRSNPPIDQRLASTIALIIFTVFNVILVATDLTVLDRLSRYTITPYLVQLWVLSAVVSNNVGSSNQNFIFVCVLLGLAIVTFIIKIVLVVLRGRSDPVFPDPASVD